MQAKGLVLYPFVPSGPDFELAVRFFNAIGFETQWRHEGLVGLRFGGAYFMLQQIDIQVWQENQMITYEVDDLEGYWSELEALDLPGSFPGTRIGPPKDFPWGREIHFIDPAGVCWHVRQASSQK